MFISFSGHAPTRSRLIKVVQLLLALCTCALDLVDLITVHSSSSKSTPPLYAVLMPKLKERKGTGHGARMQSPKKKKYSHADMKQTFGRSSSQNKSNRHLDLPPSSQLTGAQSSSAVSANWKSLAKVRKSTRIEMYNLIVYLIVKYNK